MNKKEVWYTQYNNLYIEIVHWGIERENGFQPFNDGRGVWNYYILIPERLLTKEHFNSIWLPEKIYQFTPESPKRVSYDYYECPLANVDWHGGITYYHKEGYPVEGHRSVKAGCDFSHLQDEGQTYTLESVLAEAKETVNQLVNLLNIKTE